ncbi:MAG: Mur ligase family protein [Thermomicrobiales bacterium]
MTISLESATIPSALQSAANFRSWQRDTIEHGLLPVIGVSGGRGKSTVVRMLDAILRRAHLRTATWTNLGIEIRGKRERAEISGWSKALSRLSESSVDVAIQEVHWSTINAVGLPPASYPVFAITNLIGSHDAPFETEQAHAVRRGSLRAAQAVHSHGVLAINGDDPGLVESSLVTDSMVVMSSLSGESPNLRRQLEHGGSGVWVDGGDVRLGDLDATSVLCDVQSIQSGHRGAAQFQVANALTAIAIASSIGVDRNTISKAICEFQSAADILPGSFNDFPDGAYRVIVDGAAPSWHLRHILRAANPGNKRRQITVIGGLERLPESDVREIGRLLGRHRGAIILHSNKSARLFDFLRGGIAANDFPPVVIHLATERRALNRALKTARPDDLVLILTGPDPGPSIRAITRRLVQD